MEKTTLRRNLLIKRKELNKSDVLERSKLLVKIALDEIDLSKVEKLHCFLPIIDSNEPDMRQFIYHVAEHGAKIFTTNPKLLVDTVGLEINNYELTDDVQFDLIIVPMLAYDPRTNHRLGFGGGFYDRFLENQPNAQKIGVCFKEFGIDNLPVEEHDQPLQKIFAV